ncbi:alpha/beta hydrolase [Ideonella sp. DXS29W]|uniref:Alpha/beta hydrolase n=1 Tax=Ideonella lacteola TaxID=2984193 RepID=A0ABU9BNY1_9BURK
MRSYLSALALSSLSLLAACGGGGQSSQAVDLFQTTVYGAAELRVYSDVTYSRRPNWNGVQYTSDSRKSQELGTDQLTLKMDVWVPPNATSATPMPLVVFVHGGGYVQGGKEERADDASGYARAGFVTASINYRLTPDNTDSADLRTMAIIQASDDLMNAVRHLKANASVYHVDTSRIAIVGTSAGGGLSLVGAIEGGDAVPLAGTSSDYPGVSADVAASVSTGATLIDPMFDSDALLNYDRADAPVLLFHATPQDQTTGATWDGNVVPTQSRINASGNSCTTVPTPDAPHTVPLGIDSKWWPTVRDFLWARLNLSVI